MKHRTGCQSCRSRHRKCVFPAAGAQCYGCMEAGERCEPPSRFVFRQPQRSSEDEKAFQGSDHTATGQRLAVSLALGCEGGVQTAAIGVPSGTSITLPPTPNGGLRLNERQGHLFMLYIRQLAPMMDSCDEARHFSLTVPRLAFNRPVLLHSILALASRYDAMHRGVPPDLDTLRYNHHCIEYLIESLSKPPETYGSELLAAVVIARSYEECDFEADLSHHHLIGTRNLLTDDTVARVASQGGLAEAACWVHLRQAIYAYLVKKRPMDGDLNAFTRLTAFKRTDDSAYANRMVYHFARVLRFSLASASTSGTQSSKDSWTDLEAEVKVWYQAKPISFEPVYDSDSEEDGEIPTIIMMSIVTCEHPLILHLFTRCWADLRLPVMGLQYYYAALAIFHLKELSHINVGDGLTPIKACRQAQVSFGFSVSI